MTKARTKAEKRKGKRGRPRAEGVEREPNGRASRSANPRENPMATVLAARARVIAREAGRELPTCDDELRRIAVRNVDSLRAPWLAHPLGRAMAAEPDIVALWGVVCAILNAEEGYLSAIGAPRMRGASMGDAPPPDEAGRSVRVLTEEEADHAAVKRWRYVLGAMADTGHQAEVEAAVFHGRVIAGIAAVIRRLMHPLGISG